MLKGRKERRGMSLLPDYSKERSGVFQECFPRHNSLKLAALDVDGNILTKNYREECCFRQPLMPRSDASLDSQSDLSYSDDEDYHLAQQEWEESMQELQQLALVLLLPWVGRFLGRKTSYWRASRLVSVFIMG